MTSPEGIFYLEGRKDWFTYGYGVIVSDKENLQLNITYTNEIKIAKK